MRDSWVRRRGIGTGDDRARMYDPLHPSTRSTYGSGATANHNRSAAAYLSGAFAKTGAKPELGVTMDQLVARKISQLARAHRLG